MHDKYPSLFILHENCKEIQIADNKVFVSYSVTNVIKINYENASFERINADSYLPLQNGKSDTGSSLEGERR